MNDLYNSSTVNWDTNKIEKYVIILTLGYFGTKILNGFMDMTPKKPLRHEIQDYVNMLVLGGVLYLFTNIDKRDLLGKANTTYYLFFLGYILGLSSPYVYEALSDNQDIQNNTGIQYLFYGIFIVLFVVMLYVSTASITPNANPLFYMLYLIVLGVIILGLIATRSTTDMYLAKIYGEYPNEEEIPDDIDLDNLPKNMKRIDNEDGSITLMSDGYVEKGGTNIHFGLAFIGWSLSMLFMYQPQSDITRMTLNFMNGITLGMFVSGTSYYGFQYVLKNCEGRECWDQSCVMDKCDEPSDKTNVELLGKKTPESSKLTTMKWIVTFTLLILLCVIILFYVINSSS